MKAYRVDCGRLDAPDRSPQGYLKAIAYVTRSGVFHYQMADGSVHKELRPPQQVFDWNSLKTLSSIPITNDHPPVMLDARNTKDFIVGFTGDNVEKEKNFVRCHVTITTDEAIADLESGKKQETSCGYFCGIDETPGEWEGEHYDAIQTDIIYNHLAIVNEGRAGPQVRVHMDAAKTKKLNIGYQVRMDSQRMDVWEETENEIRFRVKDPNLFDPDTFRTKEIAGGINIIIGKLKNPPAGKEGSMVVQAYRFKKSEDWTISKAKNWISEHEIDSVDAEWTRAFINNLPDEAFAFIEGGGDKDEDGKTVPRSLRHFPHHNASVKNGGDNDSVDMPHLRNALARAPQSPFGDKAMPHLIAHAKALKIGEYAENKNRQEANMMKVILASKEYEASEELANAIKEVEKVHGDAKSKLEETLKSAEVLKGKADAMEAELTKLKAEKPDRAAIMKIARDRLEIEEFAKSVFGADAEKVDFEKMEDSEIKKAVVLKATPDAKLDGKSAEYIGARFDVLRELSGSAKGEAITDALRKIAKDGGNGEYDIAAAKQRARERTLNAWKPAGDGTKQ